MVKKFILTICLFLIPYVFIESVSYAVFYFEDGKPFSFPQVHALSRTASQ